MVDITAGVYPVLSPDKTTCTIGEFTLVVGSTLDYKPSAEEQISMGKIMEFRYAGYNQSDTQSVWMNIGDLTSKEIKTEWISVDVWHDRFANQLNEKENVTSPQPADTGNLPF